MSDLMLHGCLNIPPECWGEVGSVDAVQRYGRYKHASSRIIELESMLRFLVDNDSINDCSIEKEVEALLGAT